MPTVGARVVVSLDKAGFVRKIEQVAPVAQPIASQGAPRTPTGPMAEVAVLSSSSIVQDDRGVVVTRLAVLNTATAILGSGSRPADPDSVLALAGQLEAWATR